MPESDFLGILLKKINEGMARRANLNLQQQDLTFAQMHVLLRLYHVPERTLTLKELEGCFCLAQSTVAGLAARLEKKLLVESVADPADRRVKRIRLTERGAAVCEASREDIRRTEAQLVSRLNETEQQELKRLLTIVCDSVNGAI
ncbi:MAG: MarR family transcriptional regulator [Clostridia bacterium]|nr:MarR family transcriptional regulator [Clostridia bacterium]